ncbi:hypothetical protein [Moorena producens]|uniref:hypothetical protein n=1 Tax=Moorena producens TaxID=1155739 RepID=UPI001314FB0D|nr:hypothetical protein [Moorena producens]
MPCYLFSIPDSRFPIPDSRFPIPCSQIRCSLISLITVMIALHPPSNQTKK